MSLTTEVMAIFVIFWPILAKIWLPWQRPLDPCNQKCLLWVGQRRKPPVISYHILAISHRNAFICIYSNFSPKIGCHGNGPLSLVYESVTDEFPECTALSQNQTRHGYVAYNWSYDHFCDIFAYFGQNLVAMATSMATSLRPLQSEISSLDWSTTKTPVISNHILAISCRNSFICIYSNFSTKIGCHGNAHLSLVYGSVIDEFPQWHKPYLETKLCRNMLHTTEVMANFVIFGLFWPKFGCHGNAP